MIYNPSDQRVTVTFPPGVTEAGGFVHVAVDDVDEPRPGGDGDWLKAAIYVPYLGSAARGRYREWTGPYEVVALIDDNPRAVSIVGPGDGHAIEEGESASFTLTRLGPKDDALTVSVSIDDPGHFRRGNHWNNTPDGAVAVTFADGANTATLTVSTSDDWRDIPDNTLTATVLPSQDGSYRIAEANEGQASASVTVTDNDVAMVFELTAEPTRIVEGETALFTIRRDTATRDVDFYVLYGPRDNLSQHVYGLSPGESEIVVGPRLQDDDFDDPDERVWDLTMIPYPGMTEDEMSEYWTFKDGISSVSVTVVDNDLPLVGVEPVQNSYPEDRSGEFRVTRVGQTTGPLAVKARVTETGNSYSDQYEHFLGMERTYAFTANRQSTYWRFTLQGRDGDEADGSLTFHLLPGDGYRVDPERSVATFVVTDTDPSPTLAVPGATVSEDAGKIDFHVSLSSSLSPPSRQTVTVDYVTVGGTAEAGEDYTHVAGTLSIGPKQTSAVISVPVLDNRLFEETEAFSLELSNPVNTELQDGQTMLTAVGTIRDNEPFVSVTGGRGRD